MPFKKLMMILLSSLLAMNVYAECPACTCTMSINSFNFGNYSANSNRPTDTFNNITVMCHSPNPIANASFTIASDAGAKSHFASRALISGDYALNYNLYIDSAYTRIWGDGTGGTSVMAGSCSSTQSLSPYSCTQTFTVYGKIPGGQLKTMGGITFMNTINATLTY